MPEDRKKDTQISKRVCAYVITDVWILDVHVALV